MQTKSRILEATVMTLVKYGFEIREHRKPDDDLLHVFQRNWLRMVLGTKRFGLDTDGFGYEKLRQ